MTAPPPYHNPSSTSWSNSRSHQYNSFPDPGETTYLLPPAEQHFPGRRSFKKLSLTTYSFILITIGLVVLLPIIGLIGAEVDRAIYADPKDPRVRKTLLEDYSRQIKDYQAKETVVIRHFHQAEALEEEAKERIRALEQEFHERKEWERRERERMRLFWADVEPVGHCLGIRKRKHQGRLENLESGTDSILACKATAYVFDGVTYPHPDECRDTGKGVYGSWFVTNDPVCAPYWEYFRDKGCLTPGTGFHRFEAPLGGVRIEDDHELMCFSTPATILGQHFKHPTSCPLWGEYGWWGIWDVPDENCR